MCAHCIAQNSKSAPRSTAASPATKNALPRLFIKPCNAKTLLQIYFDRITALGGIRCRMMM
jgi:hypothetical protein